MKKLAALALVAFLAACSGDQPTSPTPETLGAPYWRLEGWAEYEVGEGRAMANPDGTFGPVEGYRKSWGIRVTNLPWTDRQVFRAVGGPGQVVMAPTEWGGWLQRKEYGFVGESGDGTHTLTPIEPQVAAEPKVGEVAIWEVRASYGDKLTVVYRTLWERDGQLGTSLVERPDQPGITRQYEYVFDGELVSQVYGTPGLDGMTDVTVWKRLRTGR